MASRAESSDLHNCMQFEQYTNVDYKAMKSRIKIEPKLVISPSMQIFKVGEDEHGDGNAMGPGDAVKLQHIREQYNKNPEALAMQISEGFSLQDSDDDSIDLRLTCKRDAPQDQSMQGISPCKFS